ncbi:hypothetical protein IMG5_017670, partial [Ichthyophthirius multifiliis]
FQKKKKKKMNFNIFANLPNDSDDEPQKKDTKPVKTQDKKAGAPADKKQSETTNAAQTANQNRRTQNPNARQTNYNRGDNNNNNNNQNGDQKKDYQKRAPRVGEGNVGQQNDQGARKEYKPRVNKERDERKHKGVPSEPHPQDRHSGTGIPAFQKNQFRKDGGGKGNYGTIKDEIIGREELKDGQQQIKQQSESAVVEEPEVVDNTITLAEYYSKLGYVAEENQPEAPKRQLNEEELKKEKLQLVHSKNEKQLDTQILKAQTKAKKGNTTYSVGCNSENSDLLGVKTGTTLVSYTVKKEGETIVGETKKEARKENVPSGNREQRQTQTKQHHQNRKGKVNVENEDDFPKLG